MVSVAKVIVGTMEISVAVVTGETVPLKLALMPTLVLALTPRRR